MSLIIPPHLISPESSGKGRHKGLLTLDEIHFLEALGVRPFGSHTKDIQELVDLLGTVVERSAGLQDTIRDLNRKVDELS